MSELIQLVVLAIAIVLAAIDVVRTRGEALTSWAVLLVAGLLLVLRL